METGLRNILRCPVCFSSSLRVMSFSGDGTDAPGSEEDYKIIELDTREIDNGIIFCANCKHWFPIIKKIPVLLNDESGDRSRNMEFLEKYKHIIPKEFIDTYLAKNKQP